MSLSAKLIGLTRPDEFPLRGVRQVEDPERWMFGMEFAGCGMDRFFCDGFSLITTLVKSILQLLFLFFLRAFNNSAWKSWALSGCGARLGVDLAAEVLLELEVGWLMAFFGG